MYNSYLICLAAFLYTVQYKVSKYRNTKQNNIYVASFLTNRKAACNNLKLKKKNICKTFNNYHSQGSGDSYMQ